MPQGSTIIKQLLRRGGGYGLARAYVSKRCFQTWPAGKIQRIGHRANPQFAFHTCTAQRGVLCTDVFTTASNPPHHSGESRSSRWRQEVTYTFCCIDHKIFLTTHRQGCRLSSPQTLLTSLSVSLTFVTPFFYQEILVLYISGFLQTLYQEARRGIYIHTCTPPPSWENTHTSESSLWRPVCETVLGSCMGEPSVCTCPCCVLLTGPEPTEMQLEFLLLDQSPWSNLS